LAIAPIASRVDTATPSIVAVGVSDSTGSTHDSTSDRSRLSESEMPIFDSFYRVIE
jgi:hypothetical protein